MKKKGQKGELYDILTGIKGKKRRDLRMKVQNIWRHYCTITKHRRLVRRHCFKIGLYWQGLTHDLSKYSPEEFWTGVRYYQGDRSPNAAEREDVGYSRAWMPVRYVAEMICDRIAACEVYKGNDYTSAAPLEYYEYTKKYITIHPRTRALLEKLLIMLRDKGEEATYAYLRKLLKKGTY